MTPHGIEKYLSKRLIAKVATIGENGFPHVVPVWFMHSRQQILIPTTRRSAKVRHIQADNRVAVLFDGAKRASGWGVLLQGKARLLFGMEAAKINKRIHARYLGEKALENQLVAAYFDGDDTTIIVDIQSSTSWDFRRLPLTRNLGLPVED